MTLLRLLPLSLFLLIQPLEAMELSGPTSLQRKVGDGDEAAIDILHDLGKIDQPDAAGGRTALYYAASHGELNGIRKLIKKGAKPNIKYGKTGFTAFLIAAQRDQIDALKLLIAYDETDLAAQSNEGENIFHIAIDREPTAGPQIIALLQDYKGKNQKQLFEAVNKPDKNGLTPLGKAIKKSYPRTALALSKFPGIQVSDDDRNKLEKLLKTYPTAPQSTEQEL